MSEQEGAQANTPEITPGHGQETHSTDLISMFRELDNSSLEASVKGQFRPGRTLLLQAMFAEQHGRSAEALKIYKEGLESILKVTKSCSTDIDAVSGLRHRILTTFKMYLRRAEVLQESLKSSRNQSDDPDETQSPPREIPSIAKKTLMDNLGWKLHDVCGLRHAKDVLKERVVLPLRFPHIFRGRRFLGRILLMFGAPGVGKTMLARAICSEIPGVKVFHTHSCDFISRWEGNGEKNIRELFQYARELDGPVVIILDDLEGFSFNRNDGSAEHPRRLKTELLVQLHGAFSTNDKGADMILVGITNNPVQVDRAILRRVSKLLYIPLPNKAARLGIIKNQFQTHHHCLSNDCLHELAARTEGFSCSDIVTLCRDALMQPIRELSTATHFKKCVDGKFEVCSSTDSEAIEMALNDIESEELNVRPINHQDVVACLSNVQPSVSAQEIQEYYDFAETKGVEDQFLEDNSWEPLLLKELARKVIRSQVRYCNDLITTENIPLPPMLIDYINS